MRTSNRSKALIGGAFATAAMIGAALAPATANAEPQGYIQDVFEVGLVYGTFNEGENFTLLVGGTVEEFCDVGPGDPDPGSAPARVFFRDDGSVDVKVNDTGQPIYLYEQSVGDSFDWIVSVCGETVTPFASGTADLKVRISDFGEGNLDIFNSVNGTLTASDESQYQVRASADFMLENGALVDDPADFVSFDLKKIED